MLPKFKFNFINCLFRNITSIQHNNHHHPLINNQNQQQEQNSNQRGQNYRKNFWFTNIKDNFFNLFNHHNKNSIKQQINDKEIEKLFIIINKLLNKNDKKLLNNLINNCYEDNCILYENQNLNHQNYNIEFFIEWLMKKIFNSNDNNNDSKFQILPWCRMYNSHVNSNNNNDSHLSSSLICLNPYHRSYYHHNHTISFDYQKFLKNNYDTDVDDDDDDNVDDLNKYACETITLSSNYDLINKNQPEQQQQQQQPSIKKWASLSFWEYKEIKLNNIYLNKSKILINYNKFIDNNNHDCINNDDDDHQIISLSSKLSKKTTMNFDNNQQQKQKIYSKIDNGIIIYKDLWNNIWIYNQSKYCSIFIQSPLLLLSSSSSNIIKLLPGHSIIVYDNYQFSKIKTTTSATTTIRNDMKSFRLSFVKGFGNGYKLNDITDCPCWMDVILYV